MVEDGRHHIKRHTIDSRINTLNDDGIYGTRGSLSRIDMRWVAYGIGELDLGEDLGHQVGVAHCLARLHNTHYGRVNLHTAVSCIIYE